MIWKCPRPNFLLSHAVESVMSPSLFVMFRFGVFPLGRLAVGTVNAKWQQVHCHRRFAVSLNIEGKKGKEGETKETTNHEQLLQPIGIALFSRVPYNPGSATTFFFRPRFFGAGAAAFDSDLMASAAPAAWTGGKDLLAPVSSSTKL